jgi:DNA-binding NtrC family response regulator
LRCEGAREHRSRDFGRARAHGFEVLKAIRAIDATVQVIAISGSGEIRCDTVLPAAAKLGAARTLVKPFRIEDLVCAIEEVLADSAAGTDGPRPSS